MKIYFFLITLVFSSSLFSQVVIHDISFMKQGATGKIVVQFKGELQDQPELGRENGALYVNIPGAKVLKTKEKLVGVNGPQDTKLSLYQVDNNKARLDLELPYKLPEDVLTPVTVKNQTMVVEFPIHESPPIVKAATPKVRKVEEKGGYDEKFLNELIADKKKAEAKVNQVAEIKTAQIEDLEKKLFEKDSVQLKTSSTVKGDNAPSAGDKTFATIKYVGKFSVFLVLVLGLFYMVVHFLKKGVLSKGRFGFLNGTSVITVLNTTFIGPKRSLMLVKVYNQVFLLSSSESGVNILSEINDTNGLLKEGEKLLGGNNFDTDMEKIEEIPNLEEKIKLKDDVQISSAAKARKDKFSDQIKSKIKGLRPLQ